MDKINLKLRFFLRYYFLSLIGKFSIPSNGIHLLNGHFIDLSLYPSKNDFVNFLKKLNKHYTFVSFDKAEIIVIDDVIFSCISVICSPK